MVFFQLGGKKGLGAQKVRADFKKIESQAEQKDKEREMFAANEAQQHAQVQEDNDRQM